MEKLSQDDYNHYKRQSYWTEKECISIMIGIHIDSIIDGRGNHKLDRENPLHQSLAVQMKELCETMERSLGIDLMPREDLLDLKMIGAGDPTYAPKHFLEWARSKRFRIPSELEWIKTISESGEIKYSWASDVQEDAIAKEDQCLEDGSQNTIGQNKTSDIETDDGKNKVIPEQDQAKKIEQVIKNNETSHVDGLETGCHRTDFSAKSQNEKNTVAANNKIVGAFPKITDTFPELNLEHLKRITGNWIIKYHRQGVSFSRIVLYRYVSEYFGSEVSVKYAIVFEIPHYEPAPRPDVLASTEEHLKWVKISSSKPEDPYDSFIYRDLGYGSTVSQGLPKIMDINNFGVVYNPPLREGFEREWTLIPQYKGLILPLQIRVDEGGFILYDYQSLCNNPKIVKRKTKREERILFDFFLKPIGKYYGIGCPGSKKLQYEYFSKPKNIITPEDLESIQRQLMGFCMLIEPFPKGSLRSDNHQYYFIQDVVSFLKQNKRYFPDKGSEELNVYLQNLKMKFQEFINDIYLKKRLPLLLEALAQEAELMGISIDETGIEIESSDGKLEHAPKNSDPQAWSFKSNHEGAKDLMTEEHTHYKRLNSNGYDFYKQKEFWTPLEAASIVSGYLYADSPFECNFDQIKPLYEKSIKAVLKKKLEVSRIICTNAITLMGPYKRYCPEFYEADEIYERGHIKCFNPINYVEWIKHERIVKIPPELMTCVDEEGMAAWTKSPNYNPNERKFSLGLAFHHLNKSDKERKDRYNYYKSHSLWKITEAAALLLEKNPKGLSLDDDETSQLIDFLLRAIGRGDLNRIDKQGKCYLKPFEVLELANKAGMKIPCELEYRRVGEKEIEWKTQEPEIHNNESLPDNKSKVIPDQIKKIEQVIKNIKISAENESQITFQEPGKKKKFITYDSLGLRGVHLRKFKMVLEKSPHYYKTGPSKDRKIYDSRQKQLKFISDMLLKNLFKEKFKFSIPNGYKLYELEKTKEPGTYKFKFGIEYKDTEDHDESSKNTFIKKLDVAYQKHLDDPDNTNKSERVINLTKTGMTRGFLTGEEVKKYFEKDRLEEQFSEFEKEDIQPTIDTNEDNG